MPYTGTTLSYEGEECLRNYYYDDQLFGAELLNVSINTSSSNDNATVTIGRMKPRFWGDYYASEPASIACRLGINVDGVNYETPEGYAYGHLRTTSSGWEDCWTSYSSSTVKYLTPGDISLSGGITKTGPTSNVWTITIPKAATARSVYVYMIIRGAVNDSGGRVEDLDNGYFCLNGSWSFISTPTWTVPKLPSYTVTLKDGTTTKGTTTVVRNSSYTFPSAPQKSGYTFLGWADTSSGSATHQPGSTVSSITSDKTYYEKWSLAYQEPTITLSSISRCTSSGVAADEGEYIKATISYTYDSSETNAVVYFTVKDATDNLVNISYTVSGGGNTGSMNVGPSTPQSGHTASNYKINARGTHTGELSISASIKPNSKSTETKTSTVLPGSYYLLDIARKGHSIAFGTKASESEDGMRIMMPTTFGDQTNSGTVKIWQDGTTGCIDANSTTAKIRNTAGNMYITSNNNMHLQSGTIYQEGDVVLSSGKTFTYDTVVQPMMTSYVRPTTDGYISTSDTSTNTKWKYKKFSNGTCELWGSGRFTMQNKTLGSAYDGYKFLVQEYALPFTLKANTYPIISFCHSWNNFLVDAGASFNSDLSKIIVRHCFWSDNVASSQYYTTFPDFDFFVHILGEV